MWEANRRIYQIALPNDLRILRIYLLAPPERVTKYLHYVTKVSPNPSIALTKDIHLHLHFQNRFFATKSLNRRSELVVSGSSLREKNVQLTLVNKK